jgi:hypothetical protein
MARFQFHDSKEEGSATLFVCELWRDEPVQHALQWRGLEINKRNAGLGHFRVRSGKLKDRPSEIGLVSDNHEALAGKGFEDFGEPGCIETWTQQRFHADFCL